MAFNGFSTSSQLGQPMAEINTTPLVDVMLVLLVVFLITAPLFQQAIGIDLPRTVATQATAHPQVLQLTLARDGSLHLDGQGISQQALAQRLQADRAAKAELQLQADQATPYQAIAAVMALAQQAGVNRITFVTQPQTH
ncbi:biopolymer transport protein ExbD [Aquitalea magnusonii]|jgi:biopolymer transport protein ExbD|uniref:Biopolymer transport protein ExbD n=1 Tax=Aquitalea magnusonii TaxID=332411 RepID=A0A3G9G9C8_9NEIS|nr:biopolymer transporter ExbD [Aquitalea magnusonii]BBF84074.1 biopolymer transport protein ExbD [Aquitalea magnusonii]